MDSRYRPLAAAMALAFSSTAFAQSTPESSRVLDDVQVKASRIKTVEADSSKLGSKEISSKSVATSDTASLLKDIPGVSLYGAGGVSSLPSIHGLADDRNRIKLDGMDLISACGNHMNPPLSYIDPTHVGSIKVFTGITPVSLGGDSIGGAIIVDSPAPVFANGAHLLTTGELGSFYRSNGNAWGVNATATLATENLSITYSGSTAESDNYKAGGNFKAAGPAFIASAPGGPSTYTSSKWLAGDEVGSSMYKSQNQSLGMAFRSDKHLVELRAAIQDIPYQGFPNQRMDMTSNKSERFNLSYSGQYDWGTLSTRLYHEHTRHKMNFLEDKAYWYRGNAPGMPMDTEGKNTGLVVKADIPLSARDLFRVGGEYQHYRFNDWWDPSGTGGMFPNTFLSINNGQRDRYAIFGEWEARWAPQWMSLFGIRNETVKMNTDEVRGYKDGAPYGTDAAAFNAADRSKTDNNWDLTALARYTPSANQTFEFGYARKTRSPNLYERYSWSTGGMAMNMINMAGDGNGYVGNVDLKPEVAHTLSATFDWHDAADGDWGFKITPYYSYVENYINARRCTTADGSGGACALAVQTTSNNFVFLKYINQDAQLYGIDISGYLPLAKHTGIGSFTAKGLINYVRGKTTSGTDDNLYNIMPLNTKLALEHHLGNWNNTVEAVLVSGKHDVSAIRNETQTSGYGLLNLRSSYTWKQVRLDIGVENVFDKLYSNPLGGAYVGQGITMPPGTGTGYPAYGVTVPGMGRSLYAGVNIKF